MFQWKGHVIMPRFRFPLASSAVILAVLLALAGDASATSLAPDDLELFFVQPDRSSQLRWRIVAGAPTQPIKYVIRDYWEEPVAEGQATRAEDDTVEVDVTLAQGFYNIEFVATGQRFGVMA
jgi:hypothetical protein